MLDDVQNLFDDVFFPELKEYITSNSSYSPYVFKQEPEDKLFPVVVVKQSDVTGKYTTLKYTDYIYPFNMVINVYAVQNGSISNATICDELTNIIEEFFYDVYKMKVQTCKNVANIDTNVHRNILYVSGRIDTKYGDKLIIYPDL